MITFDSLTEYIKLPKPIDFGKFEAIGWFPYEKAQIEYSNFEENVCPPRSLFKHIEDILYENGISDNKYVVIFKDKEHFDTDNFAIFFKDCYCRVGSWHSVTGYALRTLK